VQLERVFFNFFYSHIFGHLKGFVVDRTKLYVETMKVSMAVAVGFGLVFLQVFIFFVFIFYLFFS